jgi:hypothetical protein
VSESRAFQQVTLELDVTDEALLAIRHAVKSFRVVDYQLDSNLE